MFKKKRHWSRKYKNSINCRKPKGFSQKQYCKYSRKRRKTRVMGRRSGGKGRKTINKQRNIYGKALTVCSKDPITGWKRTGKCIYDDIDSGRHLVCAKMTKDFLNFTASKGNDLSSVVREGDNWCICTGRYKQAANEGVAPPLKLSATNEYANKYL